MASQRCNLRRQTNVALVRLEEMYPFPDEAVKAALADYPNAHTVRWVQEEPWNQGGWFYIHPHLKPCLRDDQTLECATRPASASSAVGYYPLHQKQQHAVIDAGLGEAPESAEVADDAVQAAGGN